MSALERALIVSVHSMWFLNHSSIQCTSTSIRGFRPLYVILKLIRRGIIPLYAFSVSVHSMWFLNRRDRRVRPRRGGVSVHSMWFLNMVCGLIGRGEHYSFRPLYVILKLCRAPAAEKAPRGFRPLYVILKPLKFKSQIVWWKLFPSTLCDS